MELDHAAMAQPLLVESFVAGREINVSLLGNDPVVAFPPVEVVIDGAVYDATSKRGGSAQLVCPAPLDRGVTKRACQLAIEAFHVLRCRDWARVDLRLDAQEQLTLLEVNTIPALGPMSSYRAAAAADGIEDFDDLVARLLEVTLARYRAQADDHTGLVKVSST